jgi:hypothetical protein
VAISTVLWPNILGWKYRKWCEERQTYVHIAPYPTAGKLAARLFRQQQKKNNMTHSVRRSEKA